MKNIALLLIMLLSVSCNRANDEQQTESRIQRALLACQEEYGFEIDINASEYTPEQDNRIGIIMYSTRKGSKIYCVYDFNDRRATLGQLD